MCFIKYIRKNLIHTYTIDCYKEKKTLPPFSLKSQLKNLDTHFFTGRIE